MLAGTVMQTLILIWVTYRTDWSKEVDSCADLLSFFIKSAFSDRIAFSILSSSDITVIPFEPLAYQYERLPERLNRCSYGKSRCAIFCQQASQLVSVLLYCSSSSKLRTLCESRWKWIAQTKMSAKIHFGSTNMNSRPSHLSASFTRLLTHWAWAHQTFIHFTVQWPSYMHLLPVSKWLNWIHLNRGLWLFFFHMSQVEKAKERLDKWEDKRKPLLKS